MRNGWMEKVLEVCPPASLSLLFLTLPSSSRVVSWSSRSMRWRPPGPSRQAVRVYLFREGREGG
jgi:hypothetical protein